ncbi:MAG: cytoplasmic protein [Spartobacteria bacterium]|nr:cytoplasmic protein [Spartobacteria bacterium]
MNGNQRSIADISVNTDNLYREESYTDLSVGHIQKLTPITIDCEDDTTRPVKFIASTQVVSPMGAIPITATIDVTTLREAIDAFPQAIQKALEDMMEQAQRMQREEASRVVIPGQNSRNDLIL